MISLKMLKKTLSKKISELSQISRKKAEALIKKQGIILNGKIEKRPYIIVVDNDKIEVPKKNIKKINLILFNKPKGCITSKSSIKSFYGFR